MAPVTLRKANPDDREFAFRVKRDAFKAYAEQVWGWDEAEQWELHARRFQAQNYRVICAGGREVGTLALVLEPDSLVVNQIFLLPEHQGQGIGARCMAWVMEEARRLGVPVRLRVLKVNPRARAFYTRLGFDGAGETEAHHLMEWRPG